jgi:hypothetical protein
LVELINHPRIELQHRPYLASLFTSKASRAALPSFTSRADKIKARAPIATVTDLASHRDIINHYISCLP